MLQVSTETEEKTNTTSTGAVQLKSVKANTKTQPINNEAKKKTHLVSRSTSSFSTESEEDEKIKLNTLKQNVNKLNKNNEGGNEKRVFFKIVRGPFYIFSSFLLVFATVMIFVAYFTNNWQTTHNTSLQYNQNQMLEYVSKKIPLLILIQTIEFCL